MMSTPGRESMVVSALRQAGELYRRRAAEWADWCAVILPGLLLVIVGGGTVLVYALTFFLPLLEMLEGLAGAGETI